MEKLFTNEELTKICAWYLFTIEKTDKRTEMPMIWATGWSDEDFCKTFQMFLNNGRRLEDFYVGNPKTEKAYPAMKMAVNHFHMRPQTFEERMSGKEPYYMKTIREIAAKKGA